MTFIASIGESIDVAAQTDPRQAPRRYDCVLSGLQTSPALIAHDGNQEGVAIELTPLGSRALTGRPAAELWDLSVELSDVVGPAAAELWEGLQDARSWRERFAHCDRVLSRLIREHRVAPPLRYCWESLVVSGGRTSVSALAAAVGWSRQHLTRRFRDEFGTSPKVAARIVRFERARRMLLATRQPLAFSQLALACGYYDQAHLNREFARLAGCTPGQLVAEEVPFVQDEDQESQRE